MTYKIMVVDDEPANLRLLERLFRRNYNVIVAASDAIADEARELEPAGVVTSILNGADFDDFAGLEYSRGDRFKITHTGSFFGKRDPRPFLTALAESGLEDVVARFVGDFRSADRDWAAQLDLGDQQGPERLRREQQRFHRTAGLDVHQGMGSGELSHLTEKMTRPLTLPDGDTPPERIAPAEGHPTGEKHEDPQTRLPYLEQHRSIRVGAAFPETGYPGNVGFVQWGEDLAEPPFQVREFRTGRQRWQLGNEVVGVGHG